MKGNDELLQFLRDNDCTPQTILSTVKLINEVFRINNVSFPTGLSSLLTVVSIMLLEMGATPVVVMPLFEKIFDETKEAFRGVIEP